MQTIKVKPWADGQGDFVTINVTDFNSTLHERLDGDDTPLPGPYDGWSRATLIAAALGKATDFINSQTDDQLRTMLEGMDRQDADRAAYERGEPIAVAVPPEPVTVVTEPVEIPADWKSKHWKQRVALAKALGWVDGEPTTEQADGWIADVIENRRRDEPQEALGGRSIREAHEIITKAGGEWTDGASVEELAELLQLAEA